MTQETDKLKNEINILKKAHAYQPKSSQGVVGYNAVAVILTNLLGSIFIGCALGLFFQYVFKTSVLLTGGLTLLGGISGLYTTTRYALKMEQKGKLKK